MSKPAFSTWSKILQHSARSPQRLLVRVFCAACLILLGLTFFSCKAATSWNGEAVAPPVKAPELKAVNWDGSPFQLSDLEGRAVVVFFGYTFCPDICPFTLAKLKQVYGALGDRAEELAVVFVSVDPQRDTVEKLANYVPNFDRRFYGLRLELDALTVMNEAWDITVQYGQPKDGPGTDSFYYVDHTGTFFLIDREGRMRVTHPPNATVDQLLPDIEALLAG